MLVPGILFIIVTLIKLDNFQSGFVILLRTTVDQFNSINLITLLKFGTRSVQGLKERKEKQQTYSSILFKITEYKQTFHLMSSLNSMGVCMFILMVYITSDNLLFPPTELIPVDMRTLFSFNMFSVFF